MQYRRSLFCLFLPLVLHGTSIVRLSLEEVVSHAQSIVEGEVVRNWCAWDSGHRFIWTHTEIAVHDLWKGSGGPNVTVSEPGGVVDGIRMDIAGMVRYSPGERVVVFLYRTPIGLIRTVGLAQGKLKVDRNGRVHPEAPGAMLASPQGVRPTGTPIGALESGTLNALRSRIMRMAGVVQGAGK